MGNATSDFVSFSMSDQGYFNDVEMLGGYVVHGLFKRIENYVNNKINK